MKKGFTLIELLAVIVILAIIALIATPIILGIIEDARKGSIEASANGYIDAVEYQLARDEIKGTETSSGVYDVANLDIDLDGEKPTSGYVEIEKGNVVEGSLCISGYNVVYESGKSKVNEACNKDGEVVLLPKVGDYIKMTPTLTSFTTDTTKTGAASTQTINPSELNLWRVIKVNEDGTIEMVSEYVSSIGIYFKGQTGYKNFVGYLNELASKYENSRYTIRSRHMGYNGQTKYLTDTSSTVDSTITTAPWPTKTLDNSNEIQGGGDILYQEDNSLVEKALGSLEATDPSQIEKIYWLASRYYWAASSTYWGYNGRFILTSGILGSHDIYYYANNSFGSASYPNSLRPILTLKSGLTYKPALGTKENPFILE